MPETPIRSHGLADGLNSETLSWDEVRNKSLFELIKIDPAYVPAANDPSFEAQVVKYRDVPISQLSNDNLLEILIGFHNSTFMLKIEQDKSRLVPYAPLMALITRQQIDKLIAKDGGIELDADKLRDCLHLNSETDKLSDYPVLRKAVQNIEYSLKEIDAFHKEYPNGGIWETAKAKMDTAFFGASIKKTPEGFTVQFSKGMQAPDEQKEKVDAATAFLRTFPNSEYTKTRNAVQISPSESSRLLELLLEGRIAQKKRTKRAIGGNDNY